MRLLLLLSALLLLLYACGAWGAGVMAAGSPADVAAARKFKSSALAFAGVGLADILWLLWEVTR